MWSFTALETGGVELTQQPLLQNKLPALCWFREKEVCLSNPFHPDLTAAEW
jgi:hypothetical protein